MNFFSLIWTSVIDECGRCSDRDGGRRIGISHGEPPPPPLRVRGRLSPCCAFKVSKDARSATGLEEERKAGKVA